MTDGATSQVTKKGKNSAVKQETGINILKTDQLADQPVQKEVYSLEAELAADPILTALKEAEKELKKKKDAGSGGGDTDTKLSLMIGKAIHLQKLKSSTQDDH